MCNWRANFQLKRFGRMAADHVGSGLTFLPVTNQTKMIRNYSRSRTFYLWIELGVSERNRFRCFVVADNHCWGSLH